MISEQLLTKQQKSDVVKILGLTITQLENSLEDAKKNGWKENVTSLTREIKSCQAMVKLLK